MASPQLQRTFPEVLQDIIGNFEQIIRSEFRLAKTEMREEAAKAVRPGATAALGLMIGLYGGAFLLLAAVYGLATLMATWLAALFVGAILAIIGLILWASGVARLKHLDPTPDKTIRSLEENAQWAKEQIK